MKTITIKGRIDVDDNVKMQLLKNISKTDLLNLTECTFCCSPALLLINKHDRKATSKEVQEFINLSNLN